MLTTKSPLSSRALPPDQRKIHNSYVRAAGSFVPKLTAKVFERYGFHSAEIMTSWASVAGTDIAAISAPERLKWPRGAAGRLADEADVANGGATLVLRVEPAHALDIEYRASEIADRINRYFGYRAVSTVKIIQAPLARPAVAPGRPAASAANLIAPPHIATIADGGLKAALTGLWSGIAADRARR